MERTTQWRCETNYTRASYNSYKILALLQKLLKLRIKMVRIVVQTVSLGAIREQEQEREQERARWSQ